MDTLFPLPKPEETVRERVKDPRPVPRKTAICPVCGGVMTYGLPCATCEKRKQQPTKASNFPVNTYVERKPRGTRKSPYKWWPQEPVAVAEETPPDADHLSVVRNALAGMPDVCKELDTLESRIDKIWGKLTDPDMAKEIGTDHPFRIEAEERMELMQREFSRSAARLMELICAVDSHGRYITHDELYDLGATADIAMIVRVNEIEPETLRMQTWRSIDMGVCPF